MSSDNKDESNSSILEDEKEALSCNDESLKNEENKSKPHARDDDDVQALDESSMDSETKGDNKTSLKKGSKKEESEKEDSGKESEKNESGKEESEKEESEKDESEKEESEKDEKDSEEENGEKEMGLLDRPVEVTGCRARKQVERLDVSFSKPKEKHEITEGSGRKLGECPRIEFQIAKHLVVDLKPLHRILYARPGSAYDVKKNIRKFSGFDFDKKSAKFEQKKANMEKFNISTLKGMCEILDLERSGSKEEIIMRVLEFLLEPKDSGKALPKKKSSSRDKKRGTAKKPRTTQKKQKAKDTDEEEEAVDESNESEDADDDNEDEESDYESKKKSKNAPKRKAPTKAKGPNKRPKKESNKSTKQKTDDSSDSSDDEPIIKKSKMPSDEEIKKLVKRILENADLEEITMKKVIKQVFDTYPDCDLNHKKPFIKTTIKSVIS